MRSMAVSPAYRAKAREQNCTTEVEASRMTPTLNMKELIMVLPGCMGCTVKTTKFTPNLVQPLTVIAIR